MSCKRNTMLAVVAGFSLATAAAATPLMPRQISSFAPNVHSGASLNANLGVLRQIIAWDDSADAHSYQLAQRMRDRGKTFTRVALATIPQGA